MADQIKRLCLMNGRRHMRSGGGAHPGADAGSMHAGIVVRRVLDLMRDGAAGRQAQ